MSLDADDLVVELPGGGELHLQAEDEVSRFDGLKDRYMHDFRLTKITDLAMLDSLLIAHITQYRAQRKLSGFEPEFDDEGLATGKYTKVELSASQTAETLRAASAASKEIREVQKDLGIDKKSREQSGDQTIADYIARLKDFGAEYGIHIAERTLRYEEFVNELSWRVRLEKQGDDEDKSYEKCHPDQILEWVREELEKLAAVDKQFASQRGKLVVGTF